jgi:hypothetical protein
VAVPFPFARFPVRVEMARASDKAMLSLQIDTPDGDPQVTCSPGGQDTAVSAAWHSLHGSSARLKLFALLQQARIQ